MYFSRLQSLSSHMLLPSQFIITQFTLKNINMSPAVMEVHQLAVMVAHQLAVMVAHQVDTQHLKKAMDLQVKEDGPVDYREDIKILSNTTEQQNRSFHFSTSASKLLELLV
jgi:hypothetical protein